jgi:hypothetical protein
MSINYSLFGLVSALSHQLQNRTSVVKLYIKWDTLVVEYNVSIEKNKSGEERFYISTPVSKEEIRSKTVFEKILPAISKIKFENDVIYIRDSNYLYFYDFNLQLLFCLLSLKLNKKPLSINNNICVIYENSCYSILKDNKEEEMLYNNEDDVIKQIELYNLKEKVIN